MPERAAGIRLDRDAGIDDRVGLAELADETREIRAAAGDLEESPLAVERIVTGGEPAQRELRGGDAVFRRAAGVQRLGHRSKVDADAAGHARRDAEGVRGLLARELQQLRRARAAAEGAEGSGAVITPHVVIRIDRLGDLALDLEADEERLEERAAGRAGAFADRQGSGESGNGWMRQQAEHAIGRVG